MNNRKKGDYGYRNYFKMRQTFIISLLALFILAQLGARFLTDEQAVKNILTVMAVVTVLPAANLGATLVAVLKFKTPPKSFYEEYSRYEDKGTILYDLVITTKDAVLPMDVVIVHPTGIYAYCINKKVKVQAAEHEINEVLKTHRLDPNMKITTELSVFEKRIKSLKPASEYEDDGSVEYGAKIMKNLSM